jgi:hypothetical protein
VPGSCFYGTPGLGKDTVRFAFAKKLETLEAAVARLRAYRPEGSAQAASGLAHSSGAPGTPQR